MFDPIQPQDSEDFSVIFMPHIRLQRSGIAEAFLLLCGTFNRQPFT
ncbi:Uncharacterised protein [BD1-7 clade bacterium]|uniref:Uncharacterized protein n=1 Tax=BD1-7 clade bacterium TaxID=2029982 RepID=A0A5S9QPQ4_9GAMM|nr:Uncharacterised protein [BD1-7 clade bacterium]CAA0122218.1 Uncharacterised protein [BD1-7 clade bacterium]